MCNSSSRASKASSHSNPQEATSSSHILTAIISSLATLIILAVSIFLLLRLQPNQQSEQPPEESLVIIPGDTQPYQFDYTWSDQHHYIAHALGGIFGDTYTNSYEAFLLNYQLGHRVFEVDFQITDDGQIVLSHDYFVDASTQSFTANTYLSSLDQDKYHRLDLAHLIQIMAAYPDIHIITDSKSSDPDEVTTLFTAVVTTANAIDPTILNRFIIQIYNQDMLDDIMAIYPWRSVIYTLYADPSWTPENVLAFATTSGVKYITMWDHLVTPEILTLWQSSGIRIAAHTVNDLNAADDLLHLGVSNIYTDFLLP